MGVEVHKNYEQIDAGNIKQFKKTGTDRPDEPIYRCVICGKKASIESSCSAKGHMLMHTNCMMKTFGPDILKAFRWMEEDN